MQDMTEDEFVAVALVDIAEGHRELGRSVSEFLRMLHPLERSQVARILVKEGVITITRKFPKKYAWV